jgi:hypothetical protein
MAWRIYDHLSTNNCPPYAVCGVKYAIPSNYGIDNDLCLNCNRQAEIKAISMMPVCDLRARTR